MAFDSNVIIADLNTSTNEARAPLDRELFGKLKDFSVSLCAPPRLTKALQ
jgi:hypothetical protein